MSKARRRRKSKKSKRSKRSKRSNRRSKVKCPLTGKLPNARYCEGQVRSGPEKYKDSKTNKVYLGTKGKWKLLTEEHVENFRIKDSIKHQISVTRVCGRLGNQLFEYIYQRLVALKYGLAFESTFGKFPRPFNKGILRHHANNPQKITFPTKYDKQFPHSIKIYQKYRKQIKNMLLGSIPKTKVADVVVHVRLGDIVNNGHDIYSVLPMSFYVKAFKKIKNKKKVIIVSFPEDNFQKEYLNTLRDTLYDHFDDIKKIILQSKSISSDMITFMHAPTFVGSVGSFWFWPVFLSSQIREIHIPLFGQNYNMDLDKWKSTGNLKIVKYPRVIKRRIEGDETDRMFDI